MERLLNTLLLFSLMLPPVVLSLPVYELTTPYWHHSCGVTGPSQLSQQEMLAEEQFPDEEEQVSWHEQLLRSLEKVRHQLRNAKELLMYKEFDHLYVEVKRGVQDRQYIPNWVPSKGDTEALLAIETFTTNEIARYLPVLLGDLQKFAVAFEQVYRDEVLSYDNSPKEQALSELTGTLRQVMCEVESALWSLDLSYGPAVERSIMSPEERNIADYTHRMIRDNGILFKYRDFLAGWNRLIRVKQLIREFKKYRIQGKSRRKLRKRNLADWVQNNEERV